MPCQVAGAKVLMKPPHLSKAGCARISGVWQNIKLIAFSLSQRFALRIPVYLSSEKQGAVNWQSLLKTIEEGLTKEGPTKRTLKSLCKSLFSINFILLPNEQNEQSPPYPAFCCAGGRGSIPLDRLSGYCLAQTAALAGRQ
jgi:hypothetical protein